VADGDAVEGTRHVLAVQESVGVLIREDLDRDAELLAVVQRHVHLRDARGARVHVLVLREGRPLDPAFQVGEGGAATHGPIATAGPVAAFQDGNVVAAFQQLVRRGEAGDAASHDDDRLPAVPAEVALLQRGERGCLCGMGAGHAERAHTVEHDTGAAGDADAAKKIPACLAQ
jgi:hypothetical protein